MSVASGLPICPPVVSSQEGLSLLRRSRNLRDFTRYRTSLIGERTREVNHVHKLLGTANIKLTSVAKRKGKKKAVVPAAHSILVIAYHILKHKIPYQGLAPIISTGSTRSSSFTTGRKDSRVLASR